VQGEMQENRSSHHLLGAGSIRREKIVHEGLCWLAASSPTLHIPTSHGPPVLRNCLAFPTYPTL